MKHRTVESERYEVHIAYCDHCQHQRWCQEREDLLREADVADWRVVRESVAVAR
jgi:hypothetical protein